MMIRSTVRFLLAVGVLVCLVLTSAAGFAQSPAPQPAPPAQLQPAPPSPSPPGAPAPPTVTQIEVSGIVKITSAQVLAAVTETKVGEPLSEEKLRGDVRAINDLGWFVDVSARTEPGVGGVVVIFLVTENPTITEIVVEGNTAVPTDQIRSALGVPIGDVLNLAKMREGGRAVQKLYADKGFVLARVADLSILASEQPDQARLRVRIAEGTVESVRFEGLRRTQTIVAARYVRETRPGVLFNTNVLQHDLQRLFDSGLFESVRARPEPGSTPDSARIVIEVKEARTATASFGLGYSSSQGLVGFIEYRDRNWQGNAQSVAIRAERAIQEGSIQTFNYEVDLSDPFLDEMQTGLDLSVFALDSVQQEYSITTGAVTSRFDLQQTGASVGLSRPFDRFTTGYLRLRSELTSFTPLPINTSGPPCPDPVNCPPPSQTTPGRVVSLQLSEVSDTRNSRLTPTSGDKLLASVEVAPLWLGGSFDFTKYTIDYQRLFPTGGGSAVVTRVLGGAATGALPLQDQFILGGSSTVRGLPLGFARDRSVLVGNLEFRFPLTWFIPSFTDVGMIFFVDTGAAPFYSVPLVGYGVGVALNTPLGPIRIDLAWGPSGQRQTWLSLGAPF